MIFFLYKETSYSDTGVCFMYTLAASTRINIKLNLNIFLFPTASFYLHALQPHRTRINRNIYTYTPNSSSDSAAKLQTTCSSPSMYYPAVAKFIRHSPSKITMPHKYLMTTRWQNIALHFYTPFDVSLWVLSAMNNRQKVLFKMHPPPCDSIFHGSSSPSEFVTVIPEFYGLLPSHLMRK